MIKVGPIREQKSDITFDFWPPLRREEAPKNESCDVFIMSGGSSGSESQVIVPWSVWVNAHSALLHAEAWPAYFSLFPEFPCHDSFDSKGLNFSQTVSVDRSRL